MEGPMVDTKDTAIKNETTGGIDLGFRAHDFGRFPTMEALVDEVSSFRDGACLHFAPYKALEDVPRPLAPEWAEKTASSLGGSRIAILGCYINPVHPDPTKREQALESFENCLAIASLLSNPNIPADVPIVATETGSLDPRNVRCDENWKEPNIASFLKTMERLLKKAEENNVTMAIEAVADKNTIDTPERMLMVMETFKSPNLRVLFDAVNILPIHGTGNLGAPGSEASMIGFFDEAVAMLAPYICALHVKDFVWTDASNEFPYARGPVKKGDVPAGEGLMPWNELFRIYRRYGVDGNPMTMENFNPKTLGRSIDYIEKSYSESCFTPSRL